MLIKGKFSSAKRKSLAIVLLSMVFLNKGLTQTNYSPLYTSANFFKNIDLARPVGTIEGEAGTSPTGAATYTIPIYTPPGTNGLDPSVGITYNSQTGSGIAGYGWSIGGLSIISRTGKNIYHNGKVNPVTYTSDDAFLLDGMRLNPVTGSNGANLTVYRGEAESFSIAVSYTSGSPNNPDKFIITAKDGTLMEYGNTSDSKVMTDDGLNIMLWRLNRITDINGNYTDFKYNNDIRDTRIDEIKYSGNINTGLLPYNTIKFTYGYRYDIGTAYDAGTSLNNYFLLNKITVKHRNDDGIEETVKTYTFNYGFDNIDSYLKEIEECGAITLPVGKPEGSGEPNPCLNSTIFLYGDLPANISTFQSTLLTGNYDLLSGDYDADGKSDVLAANFYYDGDGVKRHTGYSLFKDVNNGGGATVMYNYTMPSADMLGGSYNKQFAYLSSDYNKDGKDDVLFMAGSIVELGQTFLIDKVILNTTGEFNPQTSYWDYTPNWYNYPVYQGNHYFYAKPSQNVLLPGDFDGDGNQDYILIVAARPQSNQEIFKAFISLPAKNEFNMEISGFGAGPDSYPGSYARTIAEAKRAIPIDFNGDGKMELLVTRNNITYIVAIERIPLSTGVNFISSIKYTTPNIIDDDNIFLGDFNADKKADLLWNYRFKGQNYWAIEYSNGVAFDPASFSFAQNVNISGNNILDKIVVGDFNGDGKSDIAHGYNNTSSTSKISVYYSKGRYSANPFYYEQYDNNLIMPPADVVTGDFNGDGRNDIITRFPNQAQFISIKPNGQEKLLKKVTDGHNVTTSFEYKYLTDKSSFPYVYNRTISLSDPQNQSPFNYVQLPLPVVSSVIVPDGIGGINTTNFTYEDAVLHRHAKGFLGFKKITAVNSVTGITSITESNINTQFAIAYPVKQTTKLTATNEILSENSITTSFVNMSTSTQDIRYFQKIDNTLSKDQLNGTATERINTYDAYGNITTNVTNTGYWSGTSVLVDETTTSNTTFGIHNTPFPAKPVNTTVTNTRAGMPAQSVSTSFTYLSNGLPSSKTDFAGQPLAVTATYSYNSFGNVTQTVVSATGVSNRISNVTYDTKGRYPTIKESWDGTVVQREMLTYDGKWGKPLTQISTECLTTAYTYDPYGRLKQTTFPEGYTSTNSLNWYVLWNPLQPYYILSDYSGGKPDSKIWMDIFNRGVKTETSGFNNQWLTELTTYNSRGLQATKTNSYYPTETPVVTTSSYDVYGRLQQASNPLGAINYTYTKLTGGKLQVTTQNSAGQSSSKVSDATGKVIKATDYGGDLEYTYDSRGNQVQVKHGTTILITSIYDQYGRQTSMTDKNAGTSIYSYDAYGQLTQQTDASNNTYTMGYDGFGRMINRQNGVTGELTTWEYYTGGGLTKCKGHQIKKITFSNGVLKEYVYDGLRRPQSETVTVDGIQYVTSFTYDGFSNLASTTYPSGVVINNVYDNNGSLTSVSGGDSWNPVTLFTVNSENGYGQLTSYTLGNGKTSQNTYQYGVPTRFYTPGVQDLNFNFDLTRGNLLSRTDALKSITETFQYDNLDRLTTTSVNGVQQLSMNFDGTSSFSRGNIISKTDAGNYVYSNNRIHAVNYITNPAGPTAPPITLPTMQQQVTYTSFQKAASITDGTVQTNFTYGPDYERIKTVMYVNGSIHTTKYFLGDMERINSSYIRDVHYIPVGNSIAIIEKPLYGNSTLHFIYTDYLGSLLTKTDISGIVTAEQNFDAWGRLRDPNNWQYASYITFNFYDRGFTGHEHLPYHYLINMNGRMYDPIEGRMLSPDNYVGDPWHTQGYNRYSYANNNPLKFTDPDGNFPWLAVGIAALVGGVSNGVAYVNNGGSFFNGFWRGALASGLSASFSGAIAGAMPGLGGSILAGSFGGFSGGGFSTLLNGGGGNSAMLQGLLTGGVGGGVGAYFGGGTGAFFGGAAGGGLASLLTGDNVLSGMLAGGISSFATYHLVNYINYLSSPLSSLEEMSYNSFARMGGDYQRAIVRHKEFGGVVYKDGTMWRANASQRRGTGVIYPKDVLEGKELAFMYHTHWSLSTKKIYWTEKTYNLVSRSEYYINRSAGDISYRSGYPTSGPSTWDLIYANKWQLGFNILLSRNSFYSYGQTRLSIQTQPSYNFARYNSFSMFTLLRN